ncbi:putative Late nodulin [Medicago truncatula]|uniref:Nodule Cysteine-Rich (NCR) secreted peptide n=1 Tax=Medicago truncatula TaxID=3880 RepID=A0A072UL49_MEDTR|nr:Nodule Cysteine-Rich (NCR) secreted peptide [Medicago truncatula]RHN60950.1 putative Late nodulin [Medicago truncatula]
MAKTLKNIYSIIIFLSIFLVVMNVDGELINCITDDDCPKSEFRKWVCINNICRKMCRTKV